MSLLVQQNEELHYHFPTLSQSEVNWNEHSEERENHSHNSDGRSHWRESRHSQRRDSHQEDDQGKITKEGEVT